MSNWIFDGGIVPQLTTGNGGIAPAPSSFAPTAPDVVVESIDTSPAPVAVQPSAPSEIVPPSTTRDATLAFFGIVSPQPGSGE
jgi:hypothetical protein